MKQVININFQGRVVPIEVSAFDLLKAYTESLGRHFANEEGKEEIINDIENRIGELFQERLKNGATCITDDDVNAVIKSIGRPEDFEADDETSAGTQNNSSQSSPAGNTGNNYASANTTGTYKRLYRDENNKVLGGVCSGIANYFNTDPVIIRIITVLTIGVTFLPYIILWIAVPSTASAVIGGAKKKLYRDNEDKIIAGVCSGIGNYFGISAWIPRVLFLVPFLSFIFHWHHGGFMDFPDFFKISFSPGALIIYIILWLVVPEAITTAEKLEMKGEKVDINSIKNSVVEEMKGVRERAEKFGQDARKFADNPDVRNTVRRTRTSFGDIIVLIMKVFAYFIVGCVAFGLIMALLALAFASTAIFPLKNFILSDGWGNILAWGTLIFFIYVPLIGLITWVIRRLTKSKSNRRLMRFTFISLWIVGWVCIVFLISMVSRDFRSTNNMVMQEIQLPNPAVNSIEAKGSDDLTDYNYRNRFLHFTPFTNFTDEDSFYVNNVHFRIVKSSNDSFQVSIIKMAAGENRLAAQNLASQINYPVQQLDSILKMPVGIAISKNNKFRNQHVIVTIAVPVGKHIKIDQAIWKNSPSGNGGVNINFDGDNNWDDYWGDEEHGWTTDVEYIQKPDGLYTLDGKPAGMSNYDSDDDDDDNVRPMTKVDSANQKLMQQYREKLDSLKHIKINTRLEKSDDDGDGNNNGDPQANNSYHTQLYGPLSTI